MCKVEYICQQFAILSSRDETVAPGKYHLRDLLFLKKESRDYLSKQVVPFLEKYGLRYRYDMSDGLPVSLEESLNTELLAGFGYQIDRKGYQHKRSEAVLMRQHYGENSTKGSTFVVLIDPLKEHGSSLSSAHTTATFLARLGLMSLTGDSHGLDFEYRGRHGEAYRFTLPCGLVPDDDLIVLDESVGKGIEAEPLHARLRRVQGSQFELTFSLVRTWELQPNGTRKTIYFDYVPTIDGDAAPGAANVIAADLMLIACADMLRHRMRAVKIDPSTLRLARLSLKTVVDDLIDAIDSGKLHACPNCGRPLIGNSFYCKFGACAQRYNERAKASAMIGGMTEEEVCQAYPFIQPKTVRSWFEQ